MSFPAFPIAESDLANLIRSRRTINEFEPQVPDQELVLQAIELARWAPNHKLTEPWKFHIIGPETATKIIEIQTRLLTADKGADVAETIRAKWARVPGWLFVTSDITTDALRNEENYASVSCAIQNLTLYLWSHGIGAKWITGGITRHPEFNTLLNVNPEAEKMVGLVWYGYPAAQPKKNRSPVSEITQIHP